MVEIDMTTINKWMATDEYKEAVEKWARETLDSTRKEFATEADRMFKELLTYGRTQCSVPFKEEKMEDKYFTPDIEDIRVGYYCEHTSDGLAFGLNNYDDIIVGELETCDVIQYIKWHVEDGYDIGNMIRVPFLTKEQIEEEGWKVLEKEWGTFIEKDNYMGRFTIVDGLPIITLLAKDVCKMDWLLPNSPEMFRLVLPCKDINTLRYICKLLRIN